MNGLKDALDEHTPTTTESSTGKLQYALDEIRENGHRPWWWHDRLWDRIIEPTLSDVLPWRTANYHGVAVKQQWFDSTPAVNPGAERPLIAGVEAHIRRGDDIAIIGGGYGVATAISAWATGPGGSVTVYEGGEREAWKNRRLAAEANLRDRVTVEHAVVGDAVDVWSSTNGARLVDPADLDPGDVLVMDCEGAERPILDKMEQWPRAAVVEYHTTHGAPQAAVRQLLREQYEHVETVHDGDNGVLAGWRPAYTPRRGAPEPDGRSGNRATFGSHYSRGVSND